MSCFVYLTETDEDKKKMIEALKKYHEKNSKTIKYTVVSELINENLEEGGDEVVTISTDLEYSEDDDQEEYFDGDDEEYGLSKEDFAKLKSYEVSRDIYKYTSIDHLKEILTLLDNPHIDNLETDWNSEFNTDLSQLKFDYGLICSYGYMDSWDELVNCCMIIDGGGVV